MMRRPIIGISALAIVLAIAGCGGGSGSPTPSLPQPGATPISTGSSSGGGSGSQSNARTTATFSVAISGAAQSAVAREQSYWSSRGGRTPMFVSPGTQGITITATPSGGAATTYTYDVSSGSALCVVTGGTRSCTMKVQINPGTYVFTMTLYDAAPVSGAIPASAHALGTSTLGSVTIAEGQNNAVAFSVEGIVAGAALSGGSSFLSLPANGTPHSAGLALVVTDASGAPISGTYATPIAVALAESGGSGNTVLVKNGSASGTSATLTSSTDTLSLQYNGAGAPGYTSLVTLSSGGASDAVRMSPLYVTGSLAFSDQAQSKSVSISEADSPFSTPPAVAWSCSGFTSSTSGSNASATYSVTSPSLVIGSVVPSFSCPGTVTITDALGTSITTSESGSLPVAPTCASAASNVYLGAKSGSSYEVGSGSPCAITVSGASSTCVGSPVNCVIYSPASPPSYLGSGGVSVSEANDTKAFTISGCTTPELTATISSTPGSTLLSSSAGTASIVGAANASAVNYTCTETVSDNNGKTANIVVVVDPAPGVTGPLTLPFYFIGFTALNSLGQQISAINPWDIFSDSQGHLFLASQWPTGFGMESCSSYNAFAGSTQPNCITTSVSGSIYSMLTNTTAINAALYWLGYAGTTTTSSASYNCLQDFTYANTIGTVVKGYSISVSSFAIVPNASSTLAPTNPYPPPTTWSGCYPPGV